MSGNHRRSDDHSDNPPAGAPRDPPSRAAAAPYPDAGSLRADRPAHTRRARAWIFLLQQAKRHYKSVLQRGGEALGTRNASTGTILSVPPRRSTDHGRYLRLCCRRRHVEDTDFRVRRRLPGAQRRRRMAGHRAGKQQEYRHDAATVPRFDTGNARHVKQRRKRRKDFIHSRCSRHRSHAVNVCRAAIFSVETPSCWRWIHPPSSVPECRWRRGPNKLLISDLFSYGQSVQHTVGRHRAFLTLTVGRVSKLFAVSFPRGCRRCAQAAQWRSQSLSVRRRTIARGNCTAQSGTVQVFFLLPHCSSYSCDSLIAAVGRTSSQRPQKMQQPRLNCHASSLVARSVFRDAFDGREH